MTEHSSNTDGTVLVVDDEPLIRLAAVATIEDAGYRTLEAGSADEALMLLRDRDDIGFLFTDVRMPGSMDGVSLAHVVHDGWPPIKIIVTSGHLSSADRMLPDGARFLPKPYAAQIVPYLFSHFAEVSP